MLSTLFFLFFTSESIPFDMGKLHGDAKTEFIVGMIQDQGGTPIIRDQVLHFFFKAEPNQHPRIDGDFNFWSREQSTIGLAMTHLGQGWFHFGVAVQPGARIEYAFRSNEQMVADPHNDKVIQGWAHPISVVHLPGYPDQPELAKDPSVPSGQLTTFRFRSQIRRNERDIHVYTPASYASSKEKLPVLYIGDGTAYVERAQLPQVLDHLIAAKTIPPVIAVFIEPVDRWLEYRMSTLYRMMLLEELIPHLSNKWRLDNTRQVVIGGSRGGLAALDLALNYPDRFIGCLAFAPAITGTDFTTQIHRMQVDQRPHFSILLGTYDFWKESGLAMTDAMKKKGFHVLAKEVPIGHSVQAWAGFIDELLPPLLNHRP